MTRTTLLAPVALSLAAATALLAGAGTARATCAPPMVGAAPPAQTPLPPDPVVHLFVPRRLSMRSGVEPRIEVEGEGVTATVERVAESGAMWVERLRLRTGEAGAVRILVRGAEGFDAFARTFDYPIDPGWNRPRHDRTVRPLAVQHRSYEWTCSGHDAIELTPSLDAPLYRLEWAETAEQYARGERHVALLPRSPSVLWGGLPNEEPRVEAGLINCLGRNLPTEGERNFGPEDLRFFGVAALFPDGSAVEASDLPFALSSLQRTVTGEEMGRPGAGQGEPDEPGPVWPGAVGVALCAAVAFAVGWAQAGRGRRARR